MSDSHLLDPRARRLLKTLIEHYIADGQPVGSRTLARASGLELSPATIRNVMADLEDLGLITSPHTSAGRVPTPSGYRLFVDTMLTAQRGKLRPPPLPADQPQRVIASAAGLLSSLSRFVGVVVAPRRSLVFHHVEFLRLSEQRILLILVAPDGDVQNRVLFTDIDYSESELTEAANYLNENFSGMAMEAVRHRLDNDIEHLRSEIASLMQTAVQASSETLDQAQEELVISGERNLLEVTDFASDMAQLRRAFGLFEQKTQLLRLLDMAMQARGVRIFIGGENTTQPLAMEDISVVSAPYSVDGQVVGTLGVIGPTRMPYNHVVHIVDITSRLVGNALSQHSRSD